MAIETTLVLPKAVRSIQVRHGNYQGLDARFTDSGELHSLSDLYSIELNAKNLVQLEPAARDLVQLLNQYSSFQLGDQLHLGKINISLEPEIKYTLPVLLYGVSSKWTVGFAVPVIEYSHRLSVSHSAGNLEQIRSQVAGSVGEVDAALARLNTDYAQVFYQTLAAKGYRPVGSHPEQFVGDVQLISAYHLGSYEGLSQTLRMYLSLPTGPQPDPDELTALEGLHHWGLKGSLITEMLLAPSRKFIGIASYQAIAPRERVRRVPLSASDRLPDASQKMKITEDTGDTLALAAGISQNFGTYWSAAAAYQYEYKFADQIAGVASDRAQFLEAHTEKNAHLARLEATYSTVNAYQLGRASIPWSVSYEVASVLSGHNVESSVLHEIGLYLYF
ncbi:MAG: hypothetical protein IT288_16890 [Bdellovibrionales bacterium]|nr:hypothetical protein [Bdellovibrionales bacterium]